jgi:hypothetical protein
MGYCNTVEVDYILAQALTTAKPNTTSPIKLINIGNDRNLNLVTEDIVKQYITYADSQIDGILSQQYEVPLKKCFIATYEVSSSSVGDATIVLAVSHDLIVGDEIVLRNEAAGTAETHTVQTVTDTTTIEMNDVLESYYLEASEYLNVYLAKSAYPHPINQISSRFAASFIYDKYFAAQADPNTSNYGKEMRSVAMGQLNDILNGKTILKNQMRIGDRFGNPWLSDSYSHQDRGYNTSERNMSKVT